MTSFFKYLFDKEEISYELNNYNIVQIIYLAGLVLLSGIIYVCIPDPVYLYATILMCFFILAAFVDANRNGNIRMCAVFLSLISNILYLPFCYYGFGKLICCVPIYFVLGLLYTALLINGKLGGILAIFECVYLWGVIRVIGRMLPGFEEVPPTGIDYFAIIVAILIVGVLSALAIKTKAAMYDKEYNHMKDTHLKVIDAYNSKDIFFANTSHEIRTPLNAIVGTVNLLLDENLDLQIKDNVYSILNSCNALLSITDELMQLSNTENNGVSIADTKYDIAEMLSDIINMMAVRLMESGVNLYVEINKLVPRYIIGDGGKVRQLFVNILNNAVKYTKEGKITLRLSVDYVDTDIIKLVVEVEDTGIGIKKEALPKIFSDYRRDDEDAEKRTIEGTGLGLSLCKEIIEKMGGTISVESEYHVGSTFRFDIVQKMDEFIAIAKVREHENTATIIFEKDLEHAEALKKVLDVLDIEAVIAKDRMDFETSVLSGRYYCVFIDADKYTENQRFIERKLNNHRVVIMSDVSQSVQVERNCFILTRPAHVINVAMAYNNESDAFSREIIQKGGFTCPNTTILVVDDNVTNLEVASGLLKKYEANVITAISGKECIHTLESKNIDIIFLDYMMPEMNGIDTLYAIRQLSSENAKNVPIVALTANVISGAREMFLDAGFCEYISKPIDVNKLETALKTFLPREQLRVKI